MKPTEHDKKSGILHKYNITKANGSPVDPDGWYFVLRCDYHNGCDPMHITACRNALAEYATSIKDHLPALASDISDQLFRPTSGGPDHVHSTPAFPPRLLWEPRRDDPSQIRGFLPSMPGLTLFIIVPHPDYSPIGTLHGALIPDAMEPSDGHNLRTIPALKARAEEHLANFISPLRETIITGKIDLIKRLTTTGDDPWNPVATNPTQPPIPIKK